jgi:predicted hydrocarbon binding protein
VINRILKKRAQYESLTTSTQTSLWIRQLMEDLPEEIGLDCAKAVMESCGQRCIGQSVLEKARICYDDAQDIDEFLRKLNSTHIGGGNIRRESYLIFASYERCYCGSVSKTGTPISTIYCHCSCGWYKRLFQTVLGRPVQVELIDSIIHGAERCQFKIQL